MAAVYSYNPFRESWEDAIFLHFPEGKYTTDQLRYMWESGETPDDVNIQVIPPHEDEDDDNWWDDENEDDDDD